MASVIKFCPTCEADREFRTQRRVEQYDVRGMKIELPVDCEACEVCGSVLFDEQRDGALLEQAYSTYRERRGLLAPAEIKAIRGRYELTQKAFAMLLGVSEATINRYEQGGLQDEAHDNMIRLVADPTAMKSVLERRGDRLNPRQRDKVENAIQLALLDPHTAALRILSHPSDATGLQTFAPDRFAAAVFWWCSRLGEVPEPKLNWLVFASDVWCHYRLGRALTGAVYVSRRSGPEPVDAGRLEERLDFEGHVTRCLKRIGTGFEGFVWRPGHAPRCFEFKFSREEQDSLSSLARRLEKWGGEQDDRLFELMKDFFAEAEPTQLISFSRAERLAKALEAVNT